MELVIQCVNSYINWFCSMKYFPNLSLKICKTFSNSPYNSGTAACRSYSWCADSYFIKLSRDILNAAMMFLSTLRHSLTLRCITYIPQNLPIRAKDFQSCVNDLHNYLPIMHFFQQKLNDWLFTQINSLFYWRRIRSRAN